MKIKNIACIASVLLASLSGVKAATTLTAWTFDNLPIGINSSPQPSTGLGTASALGMNNSYNNTNSVSNPDIQSLAGSSSGGANSWRIRGFSTSTGVAATAGQRMLPSARKAPSSPAARLVITKSRSHSMFMPPRTRRPICRCNTPPTAALVQRQHRLGGSRRHRHQHHQRQHG